MIRTISIDPITKIKKALSFKPHTPAIGISYGIIIGRLCKIKFKFLIKKEWNIFIIGKVLTYFGAIFIDRSKIEGTTRVISNQMKPLTEGHIVFTPEGTRSKVSKWKSGFYFIAFQSHIPISVGYIDYKTKTVGIDHILYPSGDIQKDCAKLKAFYKTVSPKNPNNYHPDWSI